MYITWSILYDEDENDDDDTADDIILGEEQIDIIIKYSFHIVKAILTNVPNANITKNSIHRHCNISEPLIAGFFGRQGKEKQTHEAKKGEMYIENIFEEPNKLNVMLHAKVVHHIDQEMGQLKVELMKNVHFSDMLKD